MGGRPKARLVLTESEQRQLESWARGRNTSQALALRSKIVLSCATGLDNKDVASRLETSQQTVSKWRNRFLAGRLTGLLDAPRPGAPRIIDDAQVDALLARTLEPTPPGTPRWSTRSMAHELGMSPAAVGRIWRAFGFQPHRLECIPLLNDPSLADCKLDILGLYLGPPLRAIVLGLSPSDKPHDAAAPTPTAAVDPAGERSDQDYLRRGASVLLAALDLATTRQGAEAERNRSSSELLKFLRGLAASVPPDLEVHLLIDGLGARPPAGLRAWFNRQSNLHVHFAPTSASWLKQAERWLAMPAEDGTEQEAQEAIYELVQAIRRYLYTHRATPGPFMWTRSLDRLAGGGGARMRAGE